MSNPNPHPTTGTAWHQGKSNRAAKRLLENLAANYSKLEGKEALLKEWEQFDPGAEETIRLRRVVRLLKVQLQNRGMMVDT